MKKQIAQEHCEHECVCGKYHATAFPYKSQCLAGTDIYDKCDYDTRLCEKAVIVHKQIQEKYKDGHWETICICPNGYNADAILLALQTKWRNINYRVI